MPRRPRTAKEKLPLGTFRVSCVIANVAHERKSVAVPGLLVDTGSECTWVPAAVLKQIGVKPRKKDEVFLMANGQPITRSVGFAIIRVGEYLTVDEVVFAQPGDLLLLGARTLEGLNLAVDPARKRLVAAGPRPAAGMS
jgi:predicted aspartyl protease